jgi:hypothetical protein
MVSLYLFQLGLASLADSIQVLFFSNHSAMFNNYTGNTSLNKFSTNISYAQFIAPSAITQGATRAA